MLIKQISVFVENKPGRLSRLTRLLTDAGIDLKALTIADTKEFGILRCIVEDPQRAIDLIRENHFTATLTDVIAVEVPDTPGGLNCVLNTLFENNISVEYLYSFVRMHGDNALIIFRVEDPQRAVEVLKDSEAKLLPGDVVYHL